MTHLQYLPGDPRLVDQIVYELKSKGIFDQFRKECIADVDTRPAYQNLRQRVESSVSSFLTRQKWRSDLNKNQLREKLRKHILDGNYLEQGVERIVDQVVNPKIASVFIPQVEDLVYNFLGIKREKSGVEDARTESHNEEPNDLLPTDLEAVSPASVKSNKEDDLMDMSAAESLDETKMIIDEEKFDAKPELGEEQEHQVIAIGELSIQEESSDKPNDKIKLEDIPEPFDIDTKDIPLPGTPDDRGNVDYKPILSDDDNSSSASDSSLIRNMSPLTPIRNYNNENSCDAQQGYENSDSGEKDEAKKVLTPITAFRFTIESKESSESSAEAPKTVPPFQYESQTNLMSMNTPVYEDSSSSNNLRIDYESDANSKLNQEVKTDTEKSETEKNGTDNKKSSVKKNSNRSSRSSKDTHSHKDRRSDSKHSRSRDRKDSKHERKSSKDDHISSKSSKSSHRSKSREKKDKNSHRHGSSHRSSSNKDSRSHKSSSHHSSKHSDDKKSSSRDKSDRHDSKSSRDKSREQKSSRSEKERKGSSSKHKHSDKDKDKKDKKVADDHYSASGKGNPRRSTDRDSNDGNSSSSKTSNVQSQGKSLDSKKDGKSVSKSDNNSSSSNTTSQSDCVELMAETSSHLYNGLQAKIVRVDEHLGIPISEPPNLPYSTEMTIKKPKFASNYDEAKKFMKMRQVLEEEQRRMNQEAALLLEFQQNVRPSLSQAYSHIPGPELEFVCFNPPEAPIDILQNDVAIIENVSNEAVEENIANTQKLNEIVENNEIHEQQLNVENNEQNNDNLQDIEKEMEQMHYEENVDSFELKYETGSDTDSNSKICAEISEAIGNKGSSELFEVTVIAEELSEDENSDPSDRVKRLFESLTSSEDNADINHLQYFSQEEIDGALTDINNFTIFFNKYNSNIPKALLCLMNCDSYEESIMKEVSENFGDYEVKNFIARVKLPTDVKMSTEEVNLTSKQENKYFLSSPIMSPTKSEYSFDLSAEYNAKLEEMVNKTSRQQVMEIILGGSDLSPSKMPKIDIYNDSHIDLGPANELKRKMETDNVLFQNKIRKKSESDQITSTTEETEDNGYTANPQRSKYLGKAKRLGLPKPKKQNLPKSPSSDKSVENYAQNVQEKKSPMVNGKTRTPHHILQRYDTSDLYKPKLHYLSRRNNVN